MAENRFPVETRFPDPREVIDFLENPESTYTDVTNEFRRLTDFNRILTTCKNVKDIETYVAQLEAIATGLRACIPNTDPALKYFYYGAFYMQMKYLPKGYTNITTEEIG